MPIIITVIWTQELIKACTKEQWDEVYSNDPVAIMELFADDIQAGYGLKGRIEEERWQK